jgi:hypothetical protein
MVLLYLKCFHGSQLIKHKENFTFSIYLLRILDAVGSVLFLETTYTDKVFRNFLPSVRQV